MYDEQGIGTIVRIETQGEVMVKWDATGLEHTYLGMSVSTHWSSGTLLPSNTHTWATHLLGYVCYCLIIKTHSIQEKPFY